MNYNEGDLGISYDMIIVWDLMVQLVLVDYFKRKVLAWDGTIVIIKNQAIF